jgi:hypothetical protein
MSDVTPAQRRFPVSAGILLGLGLGGFFDGIVLHQILQWHHMATSAGYPADSLENLPQPGATAQMIRKAGRRNRPNREPCLENRVRSRQDATIWHAITSTLATVKGLPGTDRVSIARRSKRCVN